MHRSADRVLGKRGLDRVFGLLDLAGDRVIGIDCAVGCELLQDPEAAPAGIDLIEAVAIGGVDYQVLQDALGANAGFERGILGGRCRGGADIGGGQDELVEWNVAGFAGGGHGGRFLLTGGREPSLALENPSQNPLSALFLSGAGGGPCLREQGRGAGSEPGFESATGDQIFGYDRGSAGLTRPLVLRAGSEQRRWARRGGRKPGCRPIGA